MNLQTRIIYIIIYSTAMARVYNSFQFISHLTSETRIIIVPFPGIEIIALLFADSFSSLISTKYAQLLMSAATRACDVVDILLSKVCNVSIISIVEAIEK